MVIDLGSLKVDRRIEERVKERATNKDEVLVFGSSKNKIYAFDGEVIERITSREGGVGDFAVWNGKLIDAGTYGVYETMSDELIFDDFEVTSMIGVKRDILKGINIKEKN